MRVYGACEDPACLHARHDHFGHNEKKGPCRHKVCSCKAYRGDGRSHIAKPPPSRGEDA